MTLIHDTYGSRISTSVCIMFWTLENIAWGGGCCVILYKMTVLLTKQNRLPRYRVGPLLATLYPYPLDPRCLLVG